MTGREHEDGAVASEAAPAGGEGKASALATGAEAAAEAAIALVSEGGRDAHAPLRRVRRMRILALATVTLGVFAFAVCVFTGAMLTMWAGQEIVVRDDPQPLNVFVEENHASVVWSHVAAGAVTLLAVLGYAWLHVAFRRRLRALPITAAAGKRVFPTWLVVPMTVLVAGGLGLALVGGSMLPDKPRTIDIIEKRYGGELDAQEVPVDRARQFEDLDGRPVLEAEQQHMPVPAYVREQGLDEAWMWHTFWLPLVLGLLLMILLPAVYTLQRSRDALDTLEKSGSPKSD